MLRKSADRRPSGFVEPCRPSKASAPPSGPEWVHEIKHDGFRLMVCRKGSRVRCFTCGGYDWADRYPAIVEAVRAQSFLIDGEVIVCRPDGLSDFDALRYRRVGYSATLIAFDLIQLQDDDLRDESLVKRKQQLAKMLCNGDDAIAYNEHVDHDGPAVFQHACRLGLEGIVALSQRPVKTWLKSKNPLSEAVRREREEECR
jgi:bifunctional non-homologous end joining protein LigD